MLKNAGLCPENGNLMGENLPKGDGTFLTSLDAIIDVKRMDIRSITEENEPYRNQITAKNKQLLKWRKQTKNTTDESVCLYFHKPIFYSPEKMRLTIKQLQPKLKDKGLAIKEVLCVIRGEKDILRFRLDL
ncbi:MAG: hypothetical protein K6G31_06435 [Paludibacteraceae bacterium]|nr:hypothetical protein [Paludibacteraceae bacterium]